MRTRDAMRQLNDPASVPHGLVSTSLVAGLALVEPRRLTPGRRLAYRLAIAALTAWTVWASLRPQQQAAADPFGPVGRAALAAGAAGSALGCAELGESLDARLHDGLIRAGASKPRLWLAAGEAALSLGSWWATRWGDRVFGDAGDAAHAELEETHVELPGRLRELTHMILAATSEHGAPELLAQLAGARAISWDSDQLEVAFVQFQTDVAMPVAVPGNAQFPVIARFRRLDDVTLDVKLIVSEGRLESVHVDPAQDWTAAALDAWHEADRDVSELHDWPEPHEVTLLIESSSGYRQLHA